METLLLQQGANRQKSHGRMAHAQLLGDHGIFDSEDEDEEAMEEPSHPPRDMPTIPGGKSIRRASIQMTVFSDEELNTAIHSNVALRGNVCQPPLQPRPVDSSAPYSNGPEAGTSFVPSAYAGNNGNGRASPSPSDDYEEPPPIPAADDDIAFGPGPIVPLAPAPTPSSPIIIPNMGPMATAGEERTMDGQVVGASKGFLGVGKKKGARAHRGSIKGAWELLDDDNLQALVRSKRSRRKRRWKRLKAKLMRYVQQALVLFDRVFPITHPDKPLRMVWDMILIMFVLFTLWYVPTEIGFNVPKSRAMDEFGHALDAIFLADFVLAFRTAYFDNRGTLIKSQKKIAVHYAKAWMTPDFLSSIPWDSIITAIAGPGVINTTFLNLLKLPRLLRLSKITRFLEKFKNANFLKIVQLIGAMFFITHIMGVGYYLIGKLSRSNGDVNWIDGVQASDDIVLNNWVDDYLAALYLANMFLTGNPAEARSSIEKIYSVIMLILGACFYATVVGNMALLISNMNVTAARHKQRKTVVMDVARYLNLTPDLMQRIQEYYDYLAQYSHPGPEGMSYLSDLPTPLFLDITTHMYKEKLSHVPLFQDCEEAFMDQLVLKLRHAVYMPSEVVFRFGDVGHEMYLIEKGQLAVISSTGETIAILRETNFFGELALLATARRSANVTTLSHADLLVLTAYDLQLTMKDFPESARKIRMAALERLTDLNVTKGGDSDDLQGVDKQAVKDHGASAARSQPIAKVAQNYYARQSRGMRPTASLAALEDEKVINAKNTSGAQLAIDPSIGAGPVAGRPSNGPNGPRRGSNFQTDAPSQPVGPSPMGPHHMHASVSGPPEGNEGNEGADLVQHLSTAAVPTRERRGRRLSTLRTSSMGYSITENGTFTHIGKGSVIHGEVSAKADVEAAAAIVGVTSGLVDEPDSPSVAAAAAAAAAQVVAANAQRRKSSLGRSPARMSALSAATDIPVIPSRPPAPVPEEPAVDRPKATVGFSVESERPSAPSVSFGRNASSRAINTDGDGSMDKMSSTVTSLMQEVKKMAKMQEAMMRQMATMQTAGDGHALPSVLPTEMLATDTSHLTHGARAFATIIAVARLRQKEVQADLYQARVDQLKDPKQRALFRWKMAITKVQLKIQRDKARNQRLEKARARLQGRNTKPMAF